MQPLHNILKTLLTYSKDKTPHFITHKDSLWIIKTNSPPSWRKELIIKVASFRYDKVPFCATPMSDIDIGILIVEEWFTKTKANKLRLSSSYA